MSDEEAKAAYGNVPLLFDGYYKYSFSFAGTAPDGAMIVVSLGGDASDIYKLDVGRDKPITWAGDGGSVTITKNGSVVYQGRDGWDL